MENGKLTYKTEAESSLLQKIEAQAKASTEELVKTAKLQKGQLVVVGCSTSEVCGDKLGSNSNLAMAQALFNGVYSVLQANGLFLASQCCEHLNRAIIIERKAAEKMGYEIVNVIPQPKAGGSFSTTAYKTFKDPVAVEEIKADAGLDIGGTLIGMHLKKVAVPIHLENRNIGQAIVLAARVRPKFVGGSRAVYNEEIM